MLFFNLHFERQNRTSILAYLKLFETLILLCFRITETSRGADFGGSTVFDDYFLNIFSFGAASMWRDAARVMWVSHARLNGSEQRTANNLPVSSFQQTVMPGARGIANSPSNDDGS